MKSYNISLLRGSLSRLVPAILMAFAAVAASAFPTDFYAKNSVLATGRWVKIGVEKSGLYMIPAATLNSWGFTDVSKVRIHGYGGRRIGDIMTEETFIDDLPAIASEATDDGVVFYAAGPDDWASSTGGRYHGVLSPYTLLGYYFVTEAEEAAPAVPAVGSSEADSPSTTAYSLIHHEREIMQATEAGPLFVGEDFRSRNTQSFSFETPGRVAGEEVWLEGQFVHCHIGADAMLKYSVDGTLNFDKQVSPTVDNHYIHASVSNHIITFNPTKADGFELTLTYNPTRTVYQANLDYLSVCYTRKLEMPVEGVLEFWSDRSQLSLGDPDGSARVWDVTNPVSIERLSAGRVGDRLQWSVSRTGFRSYVAWRPGATLPQPQFVEKVASQNLHGYAEPVEMVILAPGEFRQQAERIAELHVRNDGLKVVVVDPVEVYNEFSSGAPDVSGVRKYLKMLYDRGQASGTALKYVLLIGRPTLDQRAIASAGNTPFSTLPWWVVNVASYSMDDNKGYGTDDFIAMLADGSGMDLGFDDLLVSVGRIPMTSVTEGNAIVDKLYQYVEKSRKGGWKNHVLILADDEDNGVHMNQADNMAKNMMASDGQQHVFTKVYIESYIKQNGTYPDARKEMYRELDAGVAWWCYAGHASNHGWTGEAMLTFTDINNMYLRNLPFVVAATCDFLRWDNPVESGGEIMYKEPNGGVIGMISATRPVYISENAYFLNSFGRHVFDRDENGKRLSAGDVYRRTKNDILNKNNLHQSNSNRLRFVFMGDPAMQVVTPSNIVELLTINGQPVDLDNQITIPALSTATITGRVVTPDGTPMTDFDGVVSVDIYDAEQSRATKPVEGTPQPFDVQGDKLFAGSSQVKGGEFTLSVPMPSQVADNFRPAAISMYAYATNSTEEAVGVNREFYVYGFDEPSEPDVTAPEIHLFVLNSDDFESGGTVNSSPMAIAEVSDNVGINLSVAGVGQQMTLTVDDNNTFTDVASFYTPSSDGSPSGVVNYPFENLSNGAHSLRLRVFDTSGNVAEQTIDFFVDDTRAPRIFEVFTDANPASESANFYVRHDRPENIVEVSVTVYDLLGHPVWSATSRGISDKDVSAPVTWNLCDMAGHRVGRGIYLYRASITTDNSHYETASRRIAVTAQ